MSTLHVLPMVEFTCNATNQGGREDIVDERRMKVEPANHWMNVAVRYFHTNVEWRAPEFWMTDMDECGWIKWTEVRPGKGETGKTDERL